MQTNPGRAYKYKRKSQSETWHRCRPLPSFPFLSFLQHQPANPFVRFHPRDPSSVILFNITNLAIANQDIWFSRQYINTPEGVSRAVNT